MSAKEQYCYRILESYSLLIDFEGEVHRTKVPDAIQGETFKAWKARVLGPEVSNVRVFAPIEPRAQKRMSALKEECDASHIKRGFGTLKRNIKNKSKVAVEVAVSETVEDLSTLSKSALTLILREFTDELEPSVKEFFERFKKSTDERIDAYDLIAQLIRKHNELVKVVRQKRL